MARVEKITGGRVYIRPLATEFEVGDQADVDAEMAAYLVEERGDFERVDDGEDDPSDDGDGAGTCEVVKSDGEVCGRELPCAYHSDDGGD